MPDFIPHLAYGVYFTRALQYAASTVGWVKSRRSGYLLSRSGFENPTGAFAKRWALAEARRFYPVHPA